MSSLSSIPSNFFKKSITLYSSRKHFHTLSILKLDIAQHAGPIFGFISSHNPSATKSPPEILAPPPLLMAGVPPEPPHITNVYGFDRIPTEKAADPPPVSPGPNPGPEFPRPPNRSPPSPEGPRPPMPSPPGEPEAFPPQGPDVIPPKPPEPSTPHLDIPPHVMGSDGLLFY